MIELGEWLPDQPTILSPGVYLAKNVTPAARGYRRFRDQEYIVESSTASTASNPSGLFATKADDLSVQIYMGAVNDLYKYNSTSLAFDVKSSTGSAYATATGERWRFLQWNNNVFATNYSDAIQYTTASGNAVFANAPGSPYKARYMGIVGQQMVLANVNDGANEVPWGLQWSAFGSPFGWTPGTDQSDYRELLDSAPITGFVGGEYGTILTESAIWRMSYAGPPTIFQIDKVVNTAGCDYPGTVAAFGNLVFFAGRSGFYLYDGGGVKNIGAERVNRWWLNDLNEAYAYRIYSVIDPVNSLYICGYPSTFSNAGAIDKAIVYNFTVDRWSYIDLDAQVLAQTLNPGVTLEGLDAYGTVDTIGTSFDSSLWAGGAAKLGGLRNGRLFTFTGTGKAATIETGDAEIAPTRHATINRIYPNTDGTATVQVAARARMADAVTYSTTSAVNSTGFCSVRSTGRFHRARIDVAAGEWQYLLGLDIDAKARGLR